MQKTDMKYPLEHVFHNLSPFLQRKSPFSDKQTPFSREQFFESLKDFELLVVGAGGLGCELVKNLAMSGIRNIHLVDMDTIDLTNLNRQFLFRHKDIGKYKADVVAEFVMKRCPGVQITTYRDRVQNLRQDFYQQFPIILGGLDNVAARKFLNHTVYLINKDQKETVCFYIDGSTEKLGGQVLVVEPFVTSCYNCSRKGLKEKMKANYCTIASTPRTPQHCIQYVIELRWAQEFPTRKMDNDDLQDMKWVFDQSLKRALEFKIEGVTQMLTLGVAKNIIPAVASTNAMIAAVCTNEALKLIAGFHPRLNNYFVFFGGTMIGGHTASIKKEADCETCNLRANQIPDLHVTMKEANTLAEIVTHVEKEHPDTKNPFIHANGKMLANPGDTERYPLKLQQTLKQLKEKELITSNPQSLIFSDKSLKSELKVILTIE